MTILASCGYILCYAPSSDAGSLARGDLFGCGLIVGGIMASLGTNENNIISGIPNGIPNPSILWHVVKKALEAKFMSISGVFCNYCYIVS